MEIQKIHLKNIRCFDDFTFEFDGINGSALIAGDNGTGKSTILRCLAMSLCDESSAAALFRELHGSIIQKYSKNKEAYIDLYLKDGKKYYIIETRFTRIRKLERLKQTIFLGKEKKKRTINQESFPWHLIFISGYGAGARTLGSGSIDSYLPIDAVYTLFRYDEPLQNPELALRRYESEYLNETNEISKNTNSGLDIFLTMIRDILNLTENDQVLLTKKGIEVRGPWGKTELESLGDGYKSTITWVLDLIGRRLIFGKTLDPKRMTGIVLLDEIEQHLHPKWQLRIMDLITTAFPKMQFIITTHSPLVISGSSGVKTHRIEKGVSSGLDIDGWRVEDIYRDIMGMESQRPKDISDDIKEFQSLDFERLKNKLNKNKDKRYLELKTILKNKLHGNDPLLQLIKLENITKKISDDKNK